MSAEPARVLLVDDQALFRGALASLLEGSPDFVVVGQASDGRAGVEEAMRLKPDIVLLDVEMPVLDGIGAAALLLERLPGVKIVMLTVSDDDEHLLSAIRLGVHGYLLKDMTPDEFFAMLHRVLRQETPVSPELLGRLLAELRSPSQPRTPGQIEDAEPLSRREVEILRLVADGLTNREIGQRLFITEGTVKNHMHNALRKLHVSTRGQAAAYVLREGLTGL